MYAYKIFLFFILFSTLLIHNCYAMESAENNAITLSHIIPLDDGLTTTIPGIIANTYYDFLKQERYIRSTTEETNTLLALITQKKKLDNNYIPMQLFCPIVLRQSSGSIENLGPLNSTKHREALSAVCNKNALYYTKKQGAIIYPLTEQLNPDIVDQITELLKKIKQQAIIT